MTMRSLRTILFLAPLCVLVFSGPVFAECITSSCHSGMNKTKSVHDPVAGGECDSCHEENGEPHPGSKVAFSLAETDSALCLMCHDDDSVLVSIKCCVLDFVNVHSLRRNESRRIYCFTNSIRVAVERWHALPSSVSM